MTTIAAAQGRSAWPAFERAAREFLAKFTTRLHDWRFWVVQAMVLGVTIAHFAVELVWLEPVSGLEPMYFVPASLYFFPVLYASLNFGREGAVPTAIWSALLAIPNILIWHHGAERVGEAFQLSTVVVLATIVATRVDREIVARHLAEEQERAVRVSQLKFHSLFDNVGQAIVVFDRAGGVREANEAAAGLFELAPGDLKRRGRVELLGRTGAASLVPPGSAERWIGNEFPLRRARDELWLEPSCTRLTEGDDELVITVFKDVTSRRGFQSYAREIVRAQESERQRIARDLHDISLQSIVLLCRRLDAVEEAAEGNAPPDVLEGLATTRDLAEEIGAELRRFSRDLRPSVLDDLGLVPAVRSLLSELSQRTGIQTRFVATGSQARLAENCEVTIFRITQECLRNIEKHSGASTVTVKLGLEAGFVRLSIADNGSGFEMPDSVPILATGGRLGLLGMRERATLAGGTFGISSRPGKGTRVTVRLPCDGDQGCPAGDEAAGAASPPSAARQPISRLNGKRP